MLHVAVVLYLRTSLDPSNRCAQGTPAALQGTGPSRAHVSQEAYWIAAELAGSQYAFSPYAPGNLAVGLRDGKLVPRRVCPARRRVASWSEPRAEPLACLTE